VSSAFPEQLGTALRDWWREQSLARGAWGAGVQLIRELWEFSRDSTPERRRSRYGDMEYDWEHRVDTTSGTVGWRERLLGHFHTAYQPTDPAAFREMMAELPIDYREFTFVDIGSGKGRVLLMAAEYPFRKILGVEILPALHRIAEDNVRSYKSPAQRCFEIASLCADAQEFEIPKQALVLYLFNPIPEAAVRTLMSRVKQSLTLWPRPVWIVYHNPLLEHALAETITVSREAAGAGYVILRVLPSATE